MGMSEEDTVELCSRLKKSLLVCVCVHVVDLREPACSTVNALWYSCSVLLSAVVYFVVLTVFISTCRLTNEEARKNWEEYGNPDGPGG